MFKVLDFCGSDAPEQSNPYEYLRKVRYPEKHDMSWYVKQTECIQISQFYKDINIDCIAEKIIIDSDWIQKITNFNLGTQNFLDSVNTVDIHYRFGSN